MRKWIWVACAAALLTWGTGDARAQGSQPQSVTTTAANPYAAKLKAARKDAIDKYNALMACIKNHPFDFAKQVEAYHAYAKAYATFQTLREQYQKWEKTHQPKFTGIVLRRQPLPGSKALSSPTTQVTASEDGSAPKVVVGVAVKKAKVTFVPLGADGKEHSKDKDKFLRATTNDVGQFGLEDLKPGKYCVQIRGEGFQPQNRHVDIPAHSTTLRVFWIERENTLAGTVTSVASLGEAGKADAAPQFVPLAGLGARPKADAKGKSKDKPAATKAGPVEGAVVTLKLLPKEKTAKPPATQEQAKRGGKPKPKKKPGLTDTTDKEGKYAIEGLRDGKYRITVKKKGFRTVMGEIEIKDAKTQNIVLLPELAPPTGAKADAKAAPASEDEDEAGEEDHGDETE